MTHSPFFFVFFFTFP
ncbi:pheA operon leader peptide PheL [Brenneria roseae]|nr:pheA operon leader peptide PheL [Brenneria roseae]